MTWTLDFPPKFSSRLPCNVLQQKDLQGSVGQSGVLVLPALVVRVGGTKERGKDAILFQTLNLYTCTLQHPFGSLDYMRLGLSELSTFQP